MPHCRWPADRYVMDEVLGKKRAYAHLQIGPGDVVLDLGAHVGSFVRWSLNHGAERVVAVEMYPPTVELLRRNFPPELYEPRVSVVAAAVTAPGTRSNLRTRYFGNPMSASVSRHNSADPRGGLEVSAVNLPVLLDTFNPTKIKFDIENSEYDAFPPAMDALTDSRVTRIMGELHTRTRETLKLAKELWWGFHDRGWETPRHVDTYYEKPNGWNVITYWKREL